MSPAARFRSVDLPHPLGPTTDKNTPSEISSVTPWMAVYRDPLGVVNAFVTRSIWIAAERSGPVMRSSYGSPIYTRTRLKLTDCMPSRSSLGHLENKNFCGILLDYARTWPDV